MVELNRASTLLQRNASRRHKLLSSAIMVGLCSSSAPLAFAQSTGAADESFALEEIVVTAQRKEESLQRAAIAVDVVSSEQLAESGITNSSNLNQLVPSLAVVQAGGSNTSYFIRGVGNFTNNGISDPAMAFNLDGVYLGRSTSTTGTFYDLQRIEVLKGPQGTLYGRNATSGAINVIPNRPKLGEVSGDASVSYGNFRAINVQGAVNLPAGDVTAFRIAANYAKHDGYNSDDTMDEDGKAVRAQVLFQPSDSFSIRLAGDYAKQEGVGSGAHLDGHYAVNPTTVPATTFFVPTTLPVDSGAVAPDSQAAFGTFFIGGASILPGPLSKPYLNNHYEGVNLEAVWKTAAGDLTALPAYRRGSLDMNFNGPNFRSGLLDETNKQTSLEVRFQGKRIGMVDYLLGAYYFDETVDGLNSYNQYVVNALLDYVSQTTSKAFFGRLTFNLTDTVRIVAGARYTKDDKSMDGKQATVVQSCLAGPPAFCIPGGSSLPPLLLTIDQYIAAGIVNPAPFVPQQYGGNPNTRVLYAPFTLNKDISFSKSTFRLAGEWDVGANSLLYTSYETGYRSGGWNLSFGRDSFQPENLKAITVGSKNRFLDGRVQLNAEVFHWQYDDQQVSHFGADARGALSYFTENAGKSTIKGVDIEGQFLATKNTLLSFSTAYLDSVFDKFLITVLDQGGGVVTGCTQSRATPTSTNVSVDCSGKDGYNSPKWTLDLGIQQTIPLSATNLVVSADTGYRGKQINGFDFLPEQINKAHWTSNASIALKEAATNAWSISAYVRNIEDKRYKTSTQYNSASGGVVTSWYSPPRTFGVRAAVSF